MGEREFVGSFSSVSSSSLAQRLNLSLIEHLAVGVYLCDSSGLVVAYNAKAADIWGEAPELGIHQKRFCGAHKLRTLDGIHVPHEHTPLAKVLDTGVGIENMRVIVERRDGSHVPVLANVVPLLGDNGEMLGFINSVQDLRPQLRDEEERLELESALRQAQKMEIVGQLTSGLAHDFNNHLAALTAALGLMRREVEKSSSELLQKRYGIAVDALDRATSLAKDLMSFAKNRPRELAEISLAASIENIRRLILSSRGAAVHHVISVPDNLWSFEANAEQLESVVLNLVLNAKDAMPNGGTITISAENVSLDLSQADPHSGFQPGDYVKLTFSDDGAGIPSGALDRIFTPFFTTKELGKGTGLGLAMVKGFVADMNGQIQARSVLGLGTTFDLFFPRYGSDLSRSIKNSSQR